jgi:hypothetical protein
LNHDRYNAKDNFFILILENILMNDLFNSKEAKENLMKRDHKEKENKEKMRKEVLAHVKSVLNSEFSNSGVEVYLVGSVIRPYAFNSNSNVDIVLKNFSGDRLDIWTNLEKKIDRDVEIILFEKCEFQEHVLEIGMKII